ncbi:MAG: hydroxymethylbilane synthase [Planctomycetes bacterium]|nr:hydroxymethylbilane synthase [Planctomycetota bacterium]
MTTGIPLRIGTRASLLARTQTGWVVERLRAHGVEVAIEIIGTRGDERRDVPIAAIGGDGVFVRELEQALLEGRIDAAVHSLKDMPTAETAGLRLACVPARATPFDALVGRGASRLEDLPAGARVGTSSIRRIVQLKAVRPDVEAIPLRGNVDTRLRKLDAGDYDALILAAAGLERLGLGDRITHLLEPPAFWPAVAQGALAVQVREADARATEAVAAIDHEATHAAATAERSMLAALAGGCLAPIGGWARCDEHGGLTLGGCVLDVDPASGAVSRIVAEESLPPNAWHAAASLGAVVAQRLVAAGAEAMLGRMRTRIA